ncbi:MAG: 1,4-alpha-glucan branching protein domain-containing protein [Planctomycetota bacterium]
MESGYLTIVLHAHLPFIRHPEYPDFLEEDWLFEAITETYIPLLQMFHRLEQEQISFALAMTLTPTLCEMLADPLLIERYSRHLKKLTHLAESEKTRYSSNDPRFHIAQVYHRFYLDIQETYFQKYQQQILRGFRDFQEKGFLEIVTCGATHGYLPLMKYEKSVQAQIRIAVQNYRKHFGSQPNGIWLPECGYKRGLEKMLQQEAIRFFFVDSHGLLFGTPRPTFGIYQPAYCENGVAFFARDIETSKQVWSAEEGYPGDPYYREFYRDLGYDAPYDYILPFLHPDGVRRNTGIKYHRVTGKIDLGKKQFYLPEKASERTRAHAAHFLECREKQNRHLQNILGISPLILSPYDAELFGHWWFEGPQFLEHIFRLGKQYSVQFITPSQYLKKHAIHQIVTPSDSSWGQAGYSQQWLNPTNAWTYRHLHQGEQHLLEMIQKTEHPTALEIRVLNQASRELLLAQSSDWAFIMSTGTTVEYATKRFKDHIHRLNQLYEMLKSHQIQLALLEEMEQRDNLFSELNYQAFKL